MAERSTELTPLAKIILGGMIGAVVLGGVVFGSIAFLERDSTTQLVILKAETTDYKKAPADKGGKKINSLDSPVLSLLDKAEELEEGIEILRPPVSEPEPPPIVVTEDELPQTIDETEAASDTASAPKAVIEVVEPTSSDEASDTATDTASTPEPETTVAAAEPTTITSSASESSNNTENTIAPEDEISAVVDSLPQKRPNTPKIVATTDVNSPSYVVQFAAFKNETSAKNTAAVLSTKHKSRLNGMALGYMRWGDYWRVVAEPMPRADANAFCSKFRSVGQDCIIKLMESPNG